ncbi:hypothetical protein GCM10023201_58320 [Actinomycetospora corticicola]|uniref:Ankyrin repeat protein n=1 Tax=Actinomycetospora corticicola TaxID=663602 RepID=A0A7Y9DSG5_9PSEU|nr:ankyrin repeat protein [Actinomycetospora corticicola]
MDTVPAGDPIAVAAVEAIREGRVQDLQALLGEHPWLATARFGTTRESRTLLHVATDWPGHHPQVGATIAALVAAGADVDARFRGPHEETPLHWAASCDDVEAADALLDAGADIEAPGAVLGGGAPIADARGFKQWAVARRLLERGATTTLIDAATLGLDDRVADLLATEPAPSAEEIDLALWGACHGGRRGCAELLVARGADVNRVPPWSDQSPWDAATAEGAHDLAQWLHERGARSTRPDTPDGAQSRREG